MTRVTELRLSEIPANFRDQAIIKARAAGIPIVNDLTATGKRRTVKRSRTTLTEPGLPLTCVGVHGCGETITKPSESSIDRHAKNCGGTRFEWKPPSDDAAAPAITDVPSPGLIRYQGGRPVKDDLAAALVAKPLTPFEGRDVIRAAIEIPNAAGGLRDAMKFEPVVMHHGQKVFVVLECDVAKVRFDPIGDTDALSRVHVFDAVAATMVDGSIVQEHLDAQRERIRLAREKAEGIERLPGMGADEDAEAGVLSIHHDAGLHAAGLVAGCPKCDAETVAVDAEKAAAKPSASKRAPAAKKAASPRKAAAKDAGNVTPIGAGRMARAKKATPADGS